MVTASAHVCFNLHHNDQEGFFLKLFFEKCIKAKEQQCFYSFFLSLITTVITVPSSYFSSYFP